MILLIIGSESWSRSPRLSPRYTAWKVIVFGVILVRIFLHSAWIRRDISFCKIQKENTKTVYHIILHGNVIKEKFIHDLTKNTLWMKLYGIYIVCLIEIFKKNLLTKFQLFMKNRLLCEIQVGYNSSISWLEIIVRR